MQKIAIIGSGISSLTAAYTLKKAGHAVTVFEAADRLGGHTATVDVETASGKYAIDTGFIVFNDWTYANFIALMNEIGVTWRDTEMSFSVKSERTGLEYNGDGFRKLFAQTSNALNLRYIRMLLEIVRFNKGALEILEPESGGLDPRITLGEYLKVRGYSDYFAQNYILAMGAAIWSSNFEQMLAFPLKFFVEFFRNHGMLSVDERPIWRTITGGSRSYLAPLTKTFASEIHLASPIIGIFRRPGGVEVHVGGKNARTEHFDGIVLGCHSDQALAMLKDPSPRELEILGAFRYQPNDTVLHTDESILPQRKVTWAAWNYLLPKKAAERVAITYNMNILQGIRSPETFLVSLNLTDRIDPAKVLRRFTYDHPIFTTETVAAQARWAEISSGATRTAFCGAYWSYGFHEDGVKSGLRAAASLAPRLHLLPRERGHLEL